MMDEVVEKFTFDPLSYYSGMIPKSRFNAASIAIWGLSLICHISQSYWKQYWFSIAFICAAILEVSGYIGRTASHFNVYNIDMFLLQIICSTIAPVFTMGGIYYQLAKLIEIYGHRFSLLPSPMAYSYIFIFSDVVSLAIQAAGGGTSGVAVNEGTSTKKGDRIFEAGIAIQLASMIIFLGLWLHFLYMIYIKVRLEYTGERRFRFSMLKIPQEKLDHLYREKYSDLRINPKRFVFHHFNLALTATVLSVIVRCCYRLAELHQGWRGFLITHEWYFIILDSSMVTSATVIMTIFHPGFAFKGRHSSIPVTHGRVDPETVESTDSHILSESTDSMEKDENEKVAVPEIVPDTDDIEKRPFYKKVPKMSFSIPFRKK